MISPDPTKTLNEPFLEYVDKYLFWCQYRRNLSEVTVIDKGYRLRQFARMVNIRTLSDVTNGSLDQFVYEMQMNPDRGTAVRASTINERLKAILIFSKWLNDIHHIQLNLRHTEVMFLKEEHRVKTYYTREEIEYVLTFSTLEEKVMIALAFDTAARLNELRNIRLTDIAGRRIVVIGKGNKQAVLCMTTPTRRLLDRYIEDYDITDWLFPTNYGSCTGPLISNTLRLKMARPFIKAGFDDFHPHALRHSSATDYQLNQATLDDVRLLLRHTDTKTTQIYLHNFDVFQMDRYDRFRKPLAV